MTYDDLKEAIDYFGDAQPDSILGFLVEASKAHLATLPRTRKVKRWVVTFDNYKGEHVAAARFYSTEEAARTDWSPPDCQFHEIEIEETVTP